MEGGLDGAVPEGLAGCAAGLEGRKAGIGRTVGRRLARMNIKIETARRQLGTALALFLDDCDPVSIHCLVGPACEVIDFYAEKNGTPRFIEHALATIPGLQIAAYKKLQRQYLNAFKHASSRGQERHEDVELLASFTDERNDAALFIGWSDYLLLTRAIPIEAQAFQAWFFALHPEKLAPGVVVDRYEELFPGIGDLDRPRQKAMLRERIEVARRDPDVMNDHRTDKRPLILGWPPS